MGTSALLAAGLAVWAASPLVAPGPPQAVQPLLEAGRSWPEPVAEAFAERTRRELEGGAVRVAVVEADRAEIAGRLALAADRGPQRVEVLLDASSSANARARFESADGAAEEISVLEAERRALEHLLDGARTAGSSWV